MRLEVEAADTNWRKLFEDLKNNEQCSERYANLTTRAADNNKNIQLNRYYNVLAYDHTRVKINTSENNETYINANIVHVPKADRKYILTQGPLERTVDDFWQMCYQQHSPAILMLCKCREMETDKCFQYWPQEVGDTLHFPMASISVKLLQEVRESHNHFIVRTLLVTDTNTKDKRELKHFQYVTWPDFNVPRCPDAFLEFLSAVRKSGCLDNKAGGPPVVHCSAGIGRSGTFCLVDSCLVMAAMGVDMNLDLVKETLMEMRTYRLGLVQTEDQLRFSVSAIIAGSERFAHAQEEDDTVEEEEGGCCAVANGHSSEGGVNNSRLTNGKRVPDRRSESPNLPKKRKNSDS